MGETAPCSRDLEAFRLKRIAIPRITGQKVTKLIPFYRVTGLKGASRVGYSEGEENESGK